MADETAIVDGTDGGTREPTRTCAVTRRSLPASELIRFVAAPDGSVVPDLKRTLPGRGVWVALAKDTVRDAVRRNAFARSLKQSVTAPQDLAERVESLLRQRALASLSLANKAGAVVMGFAKVEDAVASGETLCLVHASDAASDGTGKLDRKLARREQSGSRSAIQFFSSAELSLALGRPNVVHAAIKDSGTSRKFLKDAARLARYAASAEAVLHEPAPHEDDTETE